LLDLGQYRGKPFLPDIFHCFLFPSGGTIGGHFNGGNKMKSLFYKILAIALVSGSATASAAPTVAEIAELQFHKLNRLVATKKVDAAFVDHLGAIIVAPETGDYVVSFYQEGVFSALPAAVAIRADRQGKAVSFQLVPGPTPTQFVDWKGKVPAEIFEKALEYVADTVGDTRLNVFRERITSAAIMPEASGAVVSVAAGTADGTLAIHLDLDGKVLSVDFKN
jgi:hypothetical protein